MEQEESRGMGEKMLAQALRAEGLNLPSMDPEDAEANAIWQQLTRWSGSRGRGAADDGAQRLLQPRRRVARRDRAHSTPISSG